MRSLQMELWDILDEFGNKTGKTVERGKPMKQGEYHLVIDVWIVNSNHEFLISKRIPSKYPDPGKWNPVCGSAIAGEDSLSSALRETGEELGVTLEPKNGKLTNQFKCGSNAIIDVWLFRQEVDINSVVLQLEETDEVMWATAERIRELLKNEEFIPLIRVPYIEELFEICGTLT